MTDLGRRVAKLGEYAEEPEPDDVTKPEARNETDDDEEDE